MTKYWSYAVTSSSVCAICTHANMPCLGAPGSGSLKKKLGFFFSPYGKRLTTIDLFEGL